MNLFDYMEEKKKDEKHQKLDQALDEIKKKFGDDAVFRGTLMDGK